MAFQPKFAKCAYICASLGVKNTQRAELFGTNVHILEYRITRHPEISRVVDEGWAPVFGGADKSY